MLHQIKAPQFYTDLGPQKAVLNTLANGKIQGLFKVFECFSSTFQGKFYFQGLSRQSCIFKYFSSLYEPCKSQFMFTPNFMKTIIKLKVRTPSNLKYSLFWIPRFLRDQVKCHVIIILRKTNEGYLDSVPSLTFNTIKTKPIMHAFHSSRYLQSN